MDIKTFTDLGFGLSALAIIWFTVRYFIGALSEKDDYLKEIIKSFQTNVDNFNTTINNHIDHERAAAEHQTKALISLTKAVNALAKKAK
jgi:hypothetical protein